MKNDKDHLNVLGDSINHAKDKLNPKKPQKNESSVAFRIVSDLIAGVLVGFLVGYNLDGYFDTFPTFFLICFAMGIAGSAMNIYRCFANKG